MAGGPEMWPHKPWPKYEEQVKVYPGIYTSSGSTVNYVPSLGNTTSYSASTLTTSTGYKS